MMRSIYIVTLTPSDPLGLPSLSTWDALYWALSEQTLQRPLHLQTKIYLAISRPSIIQEGATVSSIVNTVSAINVAPSWMILGRDMARYIFVTTPRYDPPKRYDHVSRYEPRYEGL